MIVLRSCLLSLMLVPLSQAFPSVLERTGVTSSSVGVVSFEFDWPDAPVPHWSIEIGEDGKGRYDQLAEGARPSADTKQAIAVSTATLERLRAGYAAVASGSCESKLRGLAKTGAKHIAYTLSGSDAWSSCTFNYSDDKALMDAAAAFQAIAETLQIGITLQHLHRFDRLGLDAEMDALTVEAKEGHAIEMQNITPTLQSIVEDERVIERVRRKAARLIQPAEPVPTSAQ